MENQERIAKLVQNDWSTAPVPKEFRRSNYGVVATLVGQIIALSGIYIGASMVGGMSLSEAFLATICGSAILAVLGGFLSWVGTKTGVGLSMLLRESFSCALAPFLALSCSELTTIDLRHFQGDLMETIEGLEPDLVMTLYTASTTELDNMFAFEGTE